MSLAVALFTLSFCIAPAEAAVIGYVPGRLLVKFRAGAPPNAVAAAHRAAHGRSLGKMPRTDVDVVEIPSGGPLSHALSSYRQNKDVEFAEPDGIAEPDLTPDDPYYLSQWYLSKLACPTAWATTTGDPSITIAILDTGVDPTHPDLAAKLVPGWNAYDGNSDTHDVYGHGTSTAGVAAALSNNRLGIASVAWGCRIMPIRISDSNGYAYYSTAAAGLIWAADHGARVANISYEVTDSSTVQSAAQYFQSKGGVVTISAGNEGTALTLPECPYALTVGATDSGDARASFSNTGPVIDLVAPGSEHHHDSQWRRLPHLLRHLLLGAVSGRRLRTRAVGEPAPLARPGASHRERVGRRSRNRGLGCPVWRRAYQRRARVQAALATVVDTVPPTVAFVTPATGASLAGSVSVQLSASDNCGLASVSLRVDGGTPSCLSAAPYAFTWDTTTASDGAHTLTATATDTSGNVATAQLAVTVSNAPPVTLPVVTIIAPVNGSSLYSNVWVAARASSKLGIARVDLYMDQTQVGSCPSGTASYWISTVTWSKGRHALTALAFDKLGNSAWSAPIYVVK